MRVLLGMQPRRMQRPPSFSEPSITAVRSPAAAAVRAAAYPALPPPRTTKSNSFIFKFIDAEEGVGEYGLKEGGSIGSAIEAGDQRPRRRGKAEKGG